MSVERAQRGSIKRTMLADCVSKDVEGLYSDRDRGNANKKELRTLWKVWCWRRVNAGDVL